MPRKLIRRWMPDPHKITKHKGLRWLGTLLDDPNLFHLNRQSVSVAFLVGLFIAFIPIPFQMVIAALIALWLRCNLPISVALVWITNPITIPPMMLIAYEIGIRLLQMDSISLPTNITLEWLISAGSQVWLPVMVGSLGCGTVLGTVGYFTIRGLWRWHVIYNWEKRKQARQKKEL